MRIIISLAALFSLIFASVAIAQTPNNLLQNGDFASGKDRSVTRWVFPQSPLKAHGADADKITWGSDADADGNRFAMVAVSGPVKAHVWWQQEVLAEGGSTYELTVRIAGDIPAGLAAGEKKGYAGTDIGIYFLDANNKWIGYQPLPTQQFTTDWQTVTLKATAPDNAARIGVRLGISSNVEIKARFDDAILILADE
ncbi:hypothetical protein OPIT5_29735 [Opitutaceae bacterium TAV5]|nr:hypothetical protein OPIT5_29735 [Opitutaceae bacterium TAV5]